MDKIEKVFNHQKPPAGENTNYLEDIPSQGGAGTPVPEVSKASLYLCLRGKVSRGEVEIRKVGGESDLRPSGALMMSQNSSL